MNPISAGVQMPGAGLGTKDTVDVSSSDDNFLQVICFSIVVFILFCCYLFDTLFDQIMVYIFLVQKTHGPFLPFPAESFGIEFYFQRKF